MKLWDNHNKDGIIEAVTGFGKTFLAILRIMVLNSVNKGATTYVVVPNLNLKEDWLKKGGHIETYKLLNVEVFVVNSYVNIPKTEKRKCHLLVLDEIHRYSREESIVFSKTLDITEREETLGLTATLGKEEKDFLQERNLFVVDTVSEQEGVGSGYITKSIIFNLGLDFTEEDRKTYDELTNKFNTIFGYFNNDFNLARACCGSKYKQYKVVFNGVEQFKNSEYWRQVVANWLNSELGRNDYTPQKITGMAYRWNQLMTDRRKLLYENQTKIKATIEILEKFPYLTVVFSESSNFANEIYKLKPNIVRPYHTNLESVIMFNGRLIAEGIRQGKKLVFKGCKTGRIYDSFERIKKDIPSAIKLSKNKRLETYEKEFRDLNSSVRVLSTVRKIDEGFDLDKIRLGIIASYTSSKRQDVQRRGRVVRKDYSNLNKEALIINLYMKNTQEETSWLKSKQKGVINVLHVDSVDEILELLTTHNRVRVKQPTIFSNSLLDERY